MGRLRLFLPFLAAALTGAIPVLLADWVCPQGAPGLFGQVMAWMLSSAFAGWPWALVVRSLLK